MSLIKERHGEDEAKRFAEVLKSVSKAEEQRNRIVHSLWGSGGTAITRTKHTAKRRKGLNFQREEFTLDDLSTFAVAISRAIYALEEYRNSLGDRSVA